MSALLASVRQIGRDLIDKRLWPVALLLLAALAAVPVLIGGSSTEPVPPGIVAAAEPGAPGATPAATASTTAKPSTTGSAASRAEGRGALDDPFFDPPAPPSEAGAGGGVGGGAAGGAGSRAVAQSPTGEAAPRAGTPPEPKAPASATAKATPPPRTAPSAPRVTPTPAATRPTSSYLRTVVRVNGGKSHPIARLTPLGGATHPAVLFLGVAKVKARYAVFVLGPRATSRGQATCKGGTDCRLIGLKAGQRQIVTVRLPNGGVRRFTLRVASIRAVGTSAARARAARARIHADGRGVVRDLRRDAASSAALRTARYDARAGLLRAAGAGAVDANASK